MPRTQEEEDKIIGSREEKGEEEVVIYSYLV